MLRTHSSAENSISDPTQGRSQLKDARCTLESTRQVPGRGEGMLLEQRKEFLVDPGLSGAWGHRLPFPCVPLDLSSLRSSVSSFASQADCGKLPPVGLAWAAARGPGGLLRVQEMQTLLGWACTTFPNCAVENIKSFGSYLLGSSACWRSHPGLFCRSSS